MELEYCCDCGVSEDNLNEPLKGFEQDLLCHKCFDDRMQAVRIDELMYSAPMEDEY